MIAVVDYGVGNLYSLTCSLRHIGAQCTVTREENALRAADRIILPGVGAFGDAMSHLKEYQLIQTIYDVVEKKTPFLGICLGLQLLFERSDESRGVNGLGILPGEIVEIPSAPGLKIPHMGWNSLNITPGSRLFKGIEKNPYVYFVHSYYLKAGRPSDVAAKTWYSVDIDASVESGNVFACQFHPEKSSQTGLQILKNFTEI